MTDSNPYLHGLMPRDPENPFEHSTTENLIRELRSFGKALHTIAARPDSHGLTTRAAQLLETAATRLEQRHNEACERVPRLSDEDRIRFVALIVTYADAVCDGGTAETAREHIHRFLDRWQGKS